MTMVLNEGQLTELRAMRDEGDATYKDLAERFGLDTWQEAKAAYTGTGDYAPVVAPASRLEALTARRLAEAPAVETGIHAEVRKARRDRNPSVDEVVAIMRAYHAGLGQEEIGAACEPPLHWLTVNEVLGEQGVMAPGKRRPPWSTATKEGMHAFAQHAGKFSADSDYVFGPERYVGGEVDPEVAGKFGPERFEAVA